MKMPGQVCTSDGTRTHNPRLRRPMPYPLGHSGLTNRVYVNLSNESREIRYNYFILKPLVKEKELFNKDLLSRK